jgi:WD40 repeat protein
LTVDTLVYLGKTENKEAKGAFFLPDGNIIAVWGDTPLILDSKSGKVLRRLDSLPNKDLANPQVSKDGLYLMVESIPGLAFYDLQSGHILKYVTDIVDYHLTLDGRKMYATVSYDKNTPGLIVEYDMANLKQTDRFCNNLLGAGPLAISPDGQTLAVSVSTTAEVKPGEKTNQVILINLNDKNSYTVLETLEPSVYSMEFSPDGKHLMYLYDNTMTGTDEHIVIYTIETKEKIYIKLKDLSTLFGFNFAGIGTPSFIDSNTILFEVGDWSNNHNYNLVWNYKDNRIKNFINFIAFRSISIKDSILLLCNQQGVLAYLNKFIVPVVDNKTPNENYITFSNNQLEYYSDKAFAGVSIIYDTTGKLIVNLGNLPFIAGKNIIRVNQTLPIGVYILTIKTGTEQISKKFIVCQ